MYTIKVIFIFYTFYLYYLKSFYFAEIQRGMIGVGEYKLRKEFQVLQQDPNEVKIPKNYSPDEIVETVKKQINDPLTMYKKISDKNFKTEINQRICSTNLKCQHKNTGTCDYNEPIDESSHPIPVFNSIAS